MDGMVKSGRHCPLCCGRLSVIGVGTLRNTYMHLQLLNWDWWCLGHATGYRMHIETLESSMRIR